MPKLSDKALRKLLREAESTKLHPEDRERAESKLEGAAVSLARENLALRKVARAAKAFMNVPGHKSFEMAEERLNNALDAYEKLAKGKVGCGKEPSDG